MITSATVNGKEYVIHRLLGHGKGGYSYLVSRNDCEFVLKQIHHDPCDYYTFGDKLQAELADYKRLCDACIRIPELIEADISKDRLVKEYIAGETVFDLVRDGENVDEYIRQVRCMAQLAKIRGLNIDYFPKNFVVSDGVIYYVDYECNAYMEQWDFENWGIKYWSRTEEFNTYLKTLTD